MLVTMKMAVISFCLLTLFSSFTNSLGLKHGHGGRKSVVVQNPVQRSAWACHPGCKRFCLSSCKRSCCTPGAPNYTPEMFPQLVNYQAALPPPPPSCPTGCPASCYPNCDAGCCFPVSQPPVYPQYPANPYDTGYPTGDPCAIQSCSAACAPQCKPDCCRSQALNLSIRPVYLGSIASPATSSSPKHVPKKTAAKKKPTPPKKTKKPAIDLKKLARKTGFLCIPPCQKLCKPICKFECCLPTYKFKDAHPAPKKPAKVHHVKPVASPQRVPVPKLLSPPEPEPEREPEPEPEQDTQQSPYAAAYQNPDPAAAMAPLTAPTCPGSCPLSCAPSCEFSCCSPYMGQPAAPVPPQQAFPYGAVPANPMMVMVPQGPPSPGLAPLTCPGQTCPDACAPLCSPGCCTGRSMLPATWDKRNTVPRVG